MKEDSFFSQFRGNFLAGLAIVLPALVSFGLLFWFFGTIANFTDALLFFVPHELTHQHLPGGGEGPMLWYWSLAALVLGVILIALTGKFARNYFGRQAIKWGDQALMSIPLLNKIYGTVKQVNEAFSSNKSSFKQVVMVSFPHPNVRSIGFITGEQKGLSNQGQLLVSVFIPTTPNPTSGFLIMLPESEIVKLNMSVADGIKFIISLGAVSPNFHTPHPGPTPAQLPLPAPAVQAPSAKTQ